MSDYLSIDAEAVQLLVLSTGDDPGITLQLGVPGPAGKDTSASITNGPGVSIASANGILTITNADRGSEAVTAHVAAKYQHPEYAKGAFETGVAVAAGSLWDLPNDMAALELSDGGVYIDPIYVSPLRNAIGAVSATDSRLSDARTPTAHNQAMSTISDMTPTGRLLGGAADAATARGAIGAIGAVAVVDSITSPGGAGSERFGAGSVASGTNSLAVGNTAKAVGNSSLAIGQGATVTETGGQGCIGVGRMVTVTGSSSLAVGHGSSCTSNGSTLVGSQATLSFGFVLVGNGNTVSNFAAMAVGASNTANQIASQIFGNGLTSTRRNETVFGAARTGGTGAWTGGHRVRVAAETSTGDTRDLFLIDGTWPDATDATRRSRVGVSAYVGTTPQEGIAVEAHSSGVRVALWGQTPAARPVLTYSRAGESPIEAQLRAALVAIGVQDSTTA